MCPPAAHLSPRCCGNRNVASMAGWAQRRGHLPTGSLPPPCKGPLRKGGNPHPSKAGGDLQGDTRVFPRGTCIPPSQQLVFGAVTCADTEGRASYAIPHTTSKAQSQGAKLPPESPCPGSQQDPSGDRSGGD